MIQAKSTICQTLECPNHSLIDRGWLLLHQYWYENELGNIESAAAAALEAQTLLSATIADATRSLLWGIAVRAVYDARDWRDISSEDMGVMIRARDNVGSWWRDQQIGWTLAHADEEGFREWCEDSASRWEAHPPLHGLLAAQWNSAHCGDSHAWRSTRLHAGRYTLLRSRGRRKEESTGIFHLLQSGQVAPFEMAMRRLWNHGSARVLEDLSQICIPSKFTRHTSELMLRYWVNFGDTAHGGSAKSVADWCLASVKGLLKATTTLDSRSFDSLVIRAFAGTLAALGKDYSVASLRLLLELNPSSRSALDSISDLAEAISHPTHDVGAASFLRELADNKWAMADGRLRTSLLNSAARLGSLDARAALFESANASNFLAIQQCLAHNLITDGNCSETINVVSLHLKNIMDQAAKGRHQGNHRPGQIAANLFLKYPRSADWDVLTRFILDPSVLADDKEGACQVLAARARAVPLEVKNTILGALQNLALTKRMPENLFDGGGARTHALDLLTLMHAAFSKSRTNLTTLMLAGDERSQINALRLLAARPRKTADFSLLQIIRNGTFTLKKMAAYTLRRVVESGLDSEATRISVELVSTDPGVAIPLNFVKGMRGDVDSWVKTEVSILEEHPSILVRRAVAKVLS